MLQRFFSWLQDLGAPQSPSNILEPHVKSFQLDQRELDEVILPYSLLNLILVVLIGVAILNTFFFDNQSTTRVLLWFCCILLPFHLPGVLCYRTYFKEEQNTELEIDQKSDLIKYKNADRNLLFHPHQIETCKWVRSGLFPHGIDYLSLTLKGGDQVHISNLIIRPEELLEDVSSPVQVEIKWLNPFPDFS